jgi:hypothetical protein
MASHSTLQYLLPPSALQLHGGCSHFLSFAAINPPISLALRHYGYFVFYIAGADVVYIGGEAKESPR